MAPRTGEVSSKKAWTDTEKITFMLILLEHSGSKITWANAPVPAGRSRIACERMYGALRTKHKDEVADILKTATFPDTNAKQGRKRSKALEDVDDDEDVKEDVEEEPKGKKRSAIASKGAVKKTKAKAKEIKREADQDVTGEDV
ncbi:hypothetical protein EJ05DRAFT_499223 [Pseudovirgaria hyperparasitica]|uniref:Uncharacterized protein n=1 Tax=Pseudovirgaria hyperparasitica TaxID=470096 RepID=A0A6A6WBH5_9PEZI|nr:uncharacterized protein EJ05DRAFT_499223 [Pseudovirgaria hyperparasitica]KAF2760033.1 hypothetical protein EJ05DRAFT_499223 [Pseudovirgaria hyperparasitica]